MPMCGRHQAAQVSFSRGEAVCSAAHTLGSGSPAPCIWGICWSFLGFACLALNWQWNSFHHANSCPFLIHPWHDKWPMDKRSVLRSQPFWMCSGLSGELRLSCSLGLQAPVPPNTVWPTEGRKAVRHLCQHMLHLHRALEQPGEERLRQMRPC